MICLNNNKFFKTLCLIIFIFCLNGCDVNKDGYNISLVKSNGWIAVQESSLILISFLMMLCVVVPVIFMTIYFSIKYRSNNINQSYDPDWSDSKKIEIAVWIIPVIIISVLAFFSYNYTYKLEPKKSIASFYKPIKINVVSLDWKWLFIYPDYHIATINEIMFPVNRPIVFEITSNSVMNSFFIPSLGSQIYAMPGMITKLNLIANDVGKYKGISSNYSGKGFSNMKFTAISVENNFIFKKWINKIKHSSNKLSTKKHFNIVSVPNENYSVKYFSHVNKNLFHEIVNKNLIKNFSISNKHSKHLIKNTNMEK